MSFTLTNPPFHPSASSLLASAALKSRPPHSACTGALVEMVTPGGETAFAARLIAESAVLRGHVRWFTTLLGKYSSVGVVVEELKRKGVRNWDVRAFVQGTSSSSSRTRRWGVGWSWGGRRPVLGDDHGVPRGLLPFPGRFAVLVPGASVRGVAGKLEEVFGGMDLRWGFRPEFSAGVGSARANVWSRAARRQQQQQQQRVSGEEGGGEGRGEDDGGQNLRNDKEMKDDDDDDDSEEDEEPALGFKVQLRVPEEGNGTEVVVSWVRGSESVLFESFCGMLKRRLIVVGGGGG